VPTAAIEGTTIHCVAAGVDAVSETAAPANIPVANEVSTFAFMIEGGEVALDPKTASQFTITLGDATTCGETFATAVIDGDATAADLKAAIELLSCVTDVTIGLTGAGTTWTGFTVTHAANTGNWPDMTVAEGTGANVIKQQADDSVLGFVVTGATTPGVYGITFDHVDHDAAANNLIALRTVKQRTAAGAAVVTTDYSLWNYDDTDIFNTTTPGLTMAQWEAALKADAGTSATDLQITYRTASTSTGLSAFRLG
jgi:hypothetical protein